MFLRDLGPLTKKASGQALRPAPPAHGHAKVHRHDDNDDNDDNDNDGNDGNDVNDNDSNDGNRQ